MLGAGASTDWNSLKSSLSMVAFDFSLSGSYSTSRYSFFTTFSLIITPALAFSKSNSGYTFVAGAMATSEAFDELDGPGT